MSGFLTNVKINNLQTELDALGIYTRQQVFAGGLKNPLGSPMICQGNNIEGAGGIDGASVSSNTLTVSGASLLNTLTTTGLLHAQSLQLDTSFETASIKTNGISAPAGTSLNINADNGQIITIGSNCRTNMGEVHSAASYSSQVYGTTISQTVNGNVEGSAVQSSLIGGVVTAVSGVLDNIGCSTNATHVTFTSPIILPADQLFDGLDVNFLAIGNALYTNTIDSNPAYLTSNTGTTTFASDVEFTRDVNFTQPLSVDDLKIAANGSITCGTANNIYDISNVGTLSAENIVTTEGIQATGDVSGDTLISNAVEIKDGTKAFVINPSTTPNSITGYPYLDLVYTDGSTTINSKIYDELLNPPPSVVANTLAGILSNSGDGGGFSITNTSSITTTKLIAPEIQFPSSVVSLTVQNSTSSGVGSVFDSLYNPPTMNLFNPSLVNFGSSISFNATKDFGRIFAISLASAYTSNFTSVEVTFDSLTIEITAWLPDAFVTGSMTYYLSFDPTTIINAYPMTPIINSAGNINFTTTKAIMLSQSYTAPNYPSKVYFMVKCAAAPPQTTIVNFQTSFTNCSVSLVSSTVGTATITS